MSSAMLVKCIDDFASRLVKKTVVIVDNASTHTSELFSDRLAVCRQQGLHIQHILPYCPELNLIEFLWKQIKYHWLNSMDFLTEASYRTALEAILAQIGTK